MSALEFRSVNLHRSVAWLRGLEPREIDWVLASAKSRRFPGKSVMTSQGDLADDLLLLWDGRARYFFQTANGKKVILMWITPGDIFGGAALVSRPSHYLFSTEAVRDSIALVWELEDSRSGATLSATPGKRTAHCSTRHEGVLRTGAPLAEGGKTAGLRTGPQSGGDAVGKYQRAGIG
jgi:Cyclic nucleotide-binding domain